MTRYFNSSGKVPLSKEELMRYVSGLIYLLSVYSPFSDRVGLPLHNTPFPGIGCPSWRQPHAWDAICLMYLTSMWRILLMTDGLNAVWSNDRASPTDTNPKNLELAPPQSITATRLDQLVYSPNYYIQIFRLTFCPQWGLNPRPKLKSNALTDSLWELFKKMFYTLFTNGSGIILYSLIYGMNILFIVSLT